MELLSLDIKVLDITGLPPAGSEQEKFWKAHIDSLRNIIELFKSMKKPVLGDVEEEEEEVEEEVEEDEKDAGDMTTKRIKILTVNEDDEKKRGRC